MEKLNLTKRPAEIGAGIPTRTERHGNDGVGAMTIPIRGITLFSADINAMYNDPDAHTALFKNSGQNSAAPRFGSTLLHVPEKFKGAKVTLKAVTMDKALVLKPATVENITLTLAEVGGLVVMDCTVKGAPADDVVVDILRMLNSKCSIAILNGSIVVKASPAEDENQGQLPLDEGGPGDDSEEADHPDAVAHAATLDKDDEVSTTGRKIQRAAKKKAPKKGS